VLLYVTAGNYATALEDEAAASQQCAPSSPPPCVQFGDYQKGLEDTGKSYELWTNVTLVAGIATAGVAGYYWYKHSKAKPIKKARRQESEPEIPAPDAPNPDEDAKAPGLRWVSVPMVGPGVIGAAAVIEF
jgi:hypothetical protein